MYRKLQCMVLMVVYLYGVDGEGMFGKNMYIDRMDNCQIQKSYPSTVKNVRIAYRENSVSIDYDIITTKPSGRNLEFALDIMRCANKENPDTCITINTLRTRQFCMMVEAKGQSWSEMVECMTPHIVCPIKKGTHVGKNCTIKTATMKIFPMGEAYWKFRAYIYDGKTAIRLCIDLFLYMK